MTKKTTYITSRVRKATYIKLHLLQFAGALLVAIAIVIAAIIYFNNKSTKVEYVEVEKIVEVEKPVAVVDQDMVDQIATELFNSYKTSYDEQQTVAFNEAENAIKAQYKAMMDSYVAEADADETIRQAEAKANEMFVEYKNQLIAEQEAARVATLSTVSVYIYYKNSVKNDFYLQITGSLHDRITYDMIYAELEATGELNEFKVDRIENKDAVEVFVGEDYKSTRTIRLTYR